MKKFLRVLLVFALAFMVSCSPKDLEKETGSENVQKVEENEEQNKSAKEDEESSSEKEFVLGQESIRNNIDPAIEWDGWFTLRSGVGETLFRFNDQIQLEPWLAESYENIDENTWTITLKDNVTFSNGEKLTPEMVVRNFERIAEKNIRADYLVGAEYSIDGNVITIKTVSPRASLINDLTDPYAAIIDLDNTEDFNKKPIGTGAYAVTEIVDDSHIVLHPNEHYWNGEPKFSKIIIKEISDKETGALALKSGEIDAYVELSPQSFQQFSQDENYVAKSLATSRVYSVYYNLETMADKNLRKAIHLALDKEAMAKYLLNDAMTPTEGPFPESTLFGTSNLNVESYNFESAKALLEESGYTDSDGDGFLDKDGEKVSINVVYYPRISNEQIATEIQATLTKLGIEAKVTKHDNNEYLKTGEYDLGLYTIVTLPTGDPESYIEGTVIENGATNFNGFNNEEARALALQLEEEFDVEKRAEIVNKMQQIILDEVAIEYIGFNNLNVVTKSIVEGYDLNPTDYYRVNVNLDIK